MSHSQEPESLPSQAPLSGSLNRGVAVTARVMACACGRCTEGILSPRLRFVMAALADCIAEMMWQVCNEQFIPYEKMKEEFVSGDIPLGFTDEDVREAGVYKSFYTGYRYVFREIARLLQERPDFVPTEENVSNALKPEALTYNPDYTSAYFDFFFKKGGRVRWALQCLLMYARRTSPAPTGDGSFVRSIYGEEPPPNQGADRWSLWEHRTHLREDWEKLVSCGNDIAYEGVSRFMGIN